MKHKVIMEAIRDELQSSDITLISNYTGLSKSCIYNIKKAKTKWPRGSTLDCLLDSLGMEFILIRKKR